MFNYKTIEEKADEWELSVRYIQTLCRQGKIPGAVKRAGIWFIPATAMQPSIKINLNGHYLMFKGTKKKIFEKSIELFARVSYELVTIKDIADEVGIGQSAVYNHFSSKQEILDTIYKFYCHYYHEERPTLEELEPTLMNGSLTEVFNSVYYEFKDKYYDLLVSTTQIIMQRAFIDGRAREIFRTLLIEQGIDYAESVFDRAIEIGRLAPFNTHIMSIYCNMSRLFLYLCVLTNVDSEYYKILMGDQEALSHYAINYLTDLHN